VSKEHVHTLVPMPRRVPVNKPVQKAKGRMWLKLQREFQWLRRQC
jgi:REP element-mobilizing transposase RayT